MISYPPQLDRQQAKPGVAAAAAILLLLLLVTVHHYNVSSPPVSPLCTNPLLHAKIEPGLQSHANLIALDDIHFQSDIQGTTIVCGNALVTAGTTFGSRVSNCDLPGLIVHGNLDFQTSGRVMGGLFYGPRSTIGPNVTVACGAHSSRKLISCREMKRAAAAQNKLLCEAEPNASVEPDGYGALLIRGSSDRDLVSFAAVDAELLGSMDTIRGAEFAKRGVVVNVYGSALKLSSAGLFGFPSAKTLWNLCGTEDVQFDAFSLQGSLLAPDAVFNSSNGHLEGQALVKSFIGAYELHQMPLACDF